MLASALLLGCGPGGSAFVASAAFDGPAVHVASSDGEALAPFRVAVEPVGTSGAAPRVDFGFDVAWTVVADAPVTVRVVTFTDGDTWVPTPWEVGVDGEETFAQSSATHRCGRGEERCEASYEAAFEVREGESADVTWTIAAWVRGRAGSLDKISDETALDVVFE